jgi:tRNA (guanine-N7-)-methyltransferase
MDWTTHYPSYTDKKITFADVGCGFGGLLFALSNIYPESLMLGMEIRIQVTEFVQQKISALRAKHVAEKGYQNISVLRTNAQKFLVNFFDKYQVNMRLVCVVTIVGENFLLFP